MNRPRLSRRLALLVMGALLSLPVLSAIIELEDAWELDASRLQLPASAPAGFQVWPCPTCEVTRAQLTADTRFYLSPGTSEVSLGEMRVALDQATWSTGLVYVFYRPSTLEVTRIVLDPTEH